MLILDLINEQTVTQPPMKIPGSGGVALPAQPDSSGDTASAIMAEPKPSPTTGKPQPTGQAAQPAQAQQAGAQSNTSQPASAAAQNQAGLEERVMKRMQELAGMLRR